jgi:hypothetical protein
MAYGAPRIINWQARTVPPITNIIEAAKEPTPGMISRLEKRPKTAIVKARTARFAFISGSFAVAGATLDNG